MSTAATDPTVTRSITTDHSAYAPGRTAQLAATDFGGSDVTAKGSGLTQFDVAPPTPPPFSGLRNPIDSRTANEFNDIGNPDDPVLLPSCNYGKRLRSEQGVG
jgi:hypothetical protein